MREYLLTQKERAILETYISDRVRLDGFSVLALRLKRAEKKLSEDFDLIETALKRMELERAT